MLSAVCSLFNVVGGCLGLGVRCVLFVVWCVFVVFCSSCVVRCLLFWCSLVVAR